MSFKELNELYQLIKEFTDKNNSTKKGILSQLQQIKIQGPTDLSVNFDKYSYQQESNDHRTYAKYLSNPHFSVTSVPGVVRYSMNLA
jgi:hypothetical protein